MVFFVVDVLFFVVDLCGWFCGLLVGGCCFLFFVEVCEDGWEGCVCGCILIIFFVGCG